MASIVTINGQRAELVSFPGEREFSRILDIDDHKVEVRTIIQKVYRLEAPDAMGLPQFAMVTGQIITTLE